MRLLRAIKLFFFVLFSKEKYDVKNKDISDGYHTFSELYAFRKMYNAAFAKIYMMYNIRHLPSATDPTTIKLNAVKSYRHSDGTTCFGGKYFVVVIILPQGQISNHYPIEDFDLFDIPEVEKAPAYDGHESSDVIERLHAFNYRAGTWKRRGLALES